MELTITRSDFERALPVGAACTSEVFDAVYPYIEECVEEYEDNFLGEKGVALIGSDARLKSIFVKFCCVSAFLHVFRQLDLVLTPTGFGVVSNKDTAPASSMRVDNLEKQLWLRGFKLKGQFVNRLRGANEWSSSDYAKIFIKRIYNEYEFFSRDTIASAEEWKQQQIAVNYWDGVVRSKISDDQMEEFLVSYRTKADDAALTILQDSFQYYVDGKDDMAKEKLRAAINYMEEHADEYGTYMDSKAYETNHYEHFKNTKEATAFIFQG